MRSKKRGSSKKAAEQKVQRKQEEAREAARLAEALKKHGEQVQSSNLVERFKDNPRTIKATEIFADKFIESGKNFQGMLEPQNSTLIWK